MDRTSLEDLKHIKGLLGGTLNDVVLGVVAGAMRRLLRDFGADAHSMALRVAVPVSVRGAAQRGTAGNRVSVWLADLPVAERDPWRRLTAVRRITEELRDSHQAEGTQALAERTGADKAVVDKYVNVPLVHDKTSLGLGKSALSAIDLCFSRATEFAYPLLIMHGREDKLTYPTGSEDFAKLAGEKNKDVTLKLWDGLYHEIHNEPEQAEVFKVMVEWLDRHL